MAMVDPRTYEAVPKIHGRELVSEAMVDPRTCEAVPIARLGGVGRTQFGTVSLLCARPGWCPGPGKCRRAQQNTPLHVAASLGNVNIFNWTAKAEPDLIGYCNVNGETPFLLAALHGKLDAFLCLDIICKEKGKNGLSYARRNDGESVLHTAMVTILFRVKKISKIIMIVISQQMLKTLKDNKDMLNTKEGGGIPGPGVLPVPKEDETTPYILGEGGSKIMGPSDLWPEGVASPQPTDPKNPDSESNQNG
ncbi:hypothetical protein LguiA_005906 [Lonicera macranthoides]